MMVNTAHAEKTANGLDPIHTLGFTGAYDDPVTACLPLGNGYRWYVPGLTRFNAPDSLSPFGAGGPNPYAYCAGDPVNRTDPTGHMFNWSRILEEVRATGHVTPYGVVRTSDSLAASSAIRASEAESSAGHEIVSANFASVSAAPSSSEKKYLPVVETWRRKYKDMGTIMVDEDTIKLGRPELTFHYSDTPPGVIREAGGIKAPNPDNPDNTLFLENSQYHGRPDSPYVASYLPADGEPVNRAGRDRRYTYYTLSTPDDLALGKLGLPGGWGDNRIVLRHRLIPLENMMGVWDRRAPTQFQSFPEFQNTYGVELPPEVQSVARLGP